MNVAIITVGDELMIGQILDTNAAWMASRLSMAGFHLCKICSVPDEKEAILQAMEDAFRDSDIVLMTGGLGPTKDDITKTALCQFFHTELVFSQTACDNLMAVLEQKHLQMNRLNKTQAEMPAACTVIPNKMGTASVSWFEQEGKLLVSMPGVPSEMSWCMEKEIIPRMRAHFRRPHIAHRFFMVYGYPESDLAEYLADWENALPSSLKLAYLPQKGIILLRLSGTHDRKECLDSLLDGESVRLRTLLGEHLLAENVQSLEETIVVLLGKRQQTLSFAESCTGGGLSARMVKVPGVSKYFKGCIVSYTDSLKRDLLFVSPGLLDTCGAVSEEVAAAMAEGARKQCHSDIALSITGYAGPTADGDIPAGTVYIALCDATQKQVRKFEFQGDREGNIHAAQHQALLMLIRYLSL